MRLSQPDGIPWILLHYAFQISENWLTLTPTSAYKLPCSPTTGAFTRSILHPLGEFVPLLIAPEENPCDLQ